MKYKELKKENKELQFRLNLANSIIDKQTEAFEGMCLHFERQLEIQDKELARRSTIIHYLEERKANYEILKLNLQIMFQKMLI